MMIIRFLNALFMSLLMATLMTLVVTAVNTGLDSGLIQRWISAWFIAWPIAFTIAFTFGELVRNLSNCIYKKFELSNPITHFSNLGMKTKKTLHSE